MAKPIKAKPKYFEYCISSSGFGSLNVQNLLKKKFEVAAQRKPTPLATYLLTFTFPCPKR